MGKNRSILLAMALLLVCAAACAAKENGSNAETPTGAELTAAATGEAGADGVSAGQAEATQTPRPTSTKIPLPTPTPFVDRSAASALLAKINVGWNLGNTFDAFGTKSGTKDETYWGNPQTTEEMIAAIKEQGFNAIRIPVTWFDHLGPAPDYVINEEWMERVETVVNYALERDMYVLLNTHHEPDSWLKPKTDGLEKVQETLAAIWTQIAGRFQDCDEHLIFEGMNEPRIKGSQQEWSGGTMEGRKAVNALNQTFIDAVRAVGGKNETRLLIICTYGNSVNDNTLKELTIPQDPNIAVAVHLYTPYFFTYDAQPGGYAKWDGSHKSEIASTMRMVDTYLISKGIPAVITEFGAVNKKMDDGAGNQTANTEEVLKWLKDYMELANKFGMKCFWWDNGNFGNSGEKFAIFNRRTLEWYAPEVADALVEYAAAEVGQE